MKIKTKIHALLVSGSLLVALVGSVMFVANRDITADRQAIQATEQLMRSAAELRMFGSETILFRESRSSDQWQRKTRSIHGELQALEIVQPAARATLERIRKNIEAANAIYADLQPSSALGAKATPFNTAEGATFVARNFAALTLVTQDVIDSAIDLNRASRLEVEQTFQTVRIAVALMLLAMLAQLAFMWRLTRGSILRPLTTFVDATQRIATGDYSVRLNMPQGDEIGTLASAFNAMSRQVQQTNQAIRLEQDNLSITLNSIGDAVLATDAAGLVTRMNPVAERLTGWPLADALGQPLTAVFHIISAETRLPSIDPVQLVMEHGQVVGLSNHTALLARDGNEYQIADSAAPIRNAAGQIVGVVLVFSDVTEKYRVAEALRASELHFEAMAQAMSDIMYRMSADWSTMHPLDGRALVASNDTPLAGWAWLEQNIPADEHARIRQAIGVSIAQKTFFSLEHRVLRPDGTIGWTASRAVPILDAQGNLREWFGAASDITARKQAEDEIRQLNANLERRVLERTTELAVANQELEAFSYSVSHDLRAPLRSIDGFSQAVLEDYADKLDDQGKDYLKRVRGATQRMGHLIDDMLTLSRVTRVEMRRGTVDLSALAADVIADLQENEPERRVDWHIEAGLVAEGDAPLLRVVLVNLLGNAWKFTGKTVSARIEFGAVSVSDTGNGPIPDTQGMTEFFVRDNGAGYDMSYAAKLFGAFQRMHLASDFAGTGVGLATVQRVVHRHGGRVWAEGAVGKGATFYFTL